MVGQEAAVVGVCPTNVAGAAPATGPQCVEATVIAHAIGGVSLDVVAAEVAQTCPCVDIARPDCDDCRDRLTTSLGGTSERLFERVVRSGVGRRKLGARWTLRGEVDRALVVTHATRLEVCLSQAMPRGAVSANVTWGHARIDR